MSQWIQDIDDHELFKWGVEIRSASEAERIKTYIRERYQVAVTIQPTKVDPTFLEIITRELRQAFHNKLHKDYAQTGNYRRQVKSGQWYKDTRVLLVCGARKYEQLHGIVRSVATTGRFITIALDDGADTIDINGYDPITYHSRGGVLLLDIDDPRVYIDAESTRHYQMLRTLCEVNSEWSFDVSTHYEDADDAGNPPVVEYCLSLGRAKTHCGGARTEREAIEKCYAIGIQTGAIFDPEKLSAQQMQVQQGGFYLANATFVCKRCTHIMTLHCSSSDDWRAILQRFKLTQEMKCPNCGAQFDKLS